MNDFIRPLGDLSPLRDPILIVAFADRGGQSGATALEHLEEAWGADDLASFDVDAFYDFQAERPRARYQEGERVIDWPSVMVRRLHVPGSARDVLTLRASEPATRWRAFAEGVMEIMEAVGARDLWIAASYPGGVPHSRDVPIWLVASDDYHLESAEKWIRARTEQLLESLVPAYTGPGGKVRIYDVSSLSETAKSRGENVDN